MRYIKNNTDFQLNNTSITLGKFDGFHKGHMKLIEQVAAQSGKFETVVFTFSTSPSKNLSDYRGDILTEDERLEIYNNLNVDTVIEFPFDENVKHMSPEKFITEVLVKKLSARLIIVGPDFRFGYQRTGNVQLLEKMSEECGYALRIVDKVRYNGDEISSTRIRRCITSGEMEDVYEMLGYHYFVMGTIIHGNMIGRTISLPTINQIPEEGKILPPNGVYASKVLIDNKEYFGITNVGCKPTVKSDKTMTVETFIFDFDEDVYGKNAKVEFYKYIRPENRFEGLDQLKKQIMQDIEVIRQNMNNIFIDKGISNR